MYILSVVLEKQHSRVALYDKEYKFLFKKNGMPASLSMLCLDTISEGGIKPTDIDYVGIAVDSSLGTPGSVAADLEKSIGVPCRGASHIGARALGEAYTANDVPTLLLLNIDDIVECGIVIKKELYTGSYQLGGRVGHMAIDVGGYECACGRRGCFEAYASNAGLRRIAAESGVADAVTLTHATLFERNTPEAERAKGRYVKYLASGITNIVNLFQPNELVLEGPFTEIGDQLMKPMMDIVLREQYCRNATKKWSLRFSNKEADTALIGAALLGR